MPQDHNRRRSIANTDVELLVSQWPQFNDKHYLVAENGINGYDSLISYLVDNGRQEWQNTLKPGQTEDESITAFRNLEIDNALLTPDMIRGSLNAFPLSMYKIGAADAYDPANFDAGEVTGTKIEDLSLNYIFAPFCIFDSLRLENVDIASGNLIGAKFNFANIVNSRFIHTDINKAYFDLSSFEKCSFLRLEAYSVNTDEGRVFYRTSFDECLFDKCNFRNNAVSGVFNDCDIVRSEIRSSTGGYKLESSIFNECNFVDSYLYTSIQSTTFYKCRMDRTLMGRRHYAGNDTISAKFRQCELRDCIIWDADLSGEFYNCSFTNTEFKAAVTFNGAIVKGCDFTGSNLDTIYATKADFKAAVSEWDPNTIWVDGTPL